MAYYLFCKEDDKWWVSFTTEEPGLNPGWMFNPRPSRTPPSSGWLYADGTGTAQEDRNLTVTTGPLPPLPGQFSVTARGAAAEKCPECLGVFYKTERWWSGRPVYVNSKGMLLYGDADWIIGPELGSYILRGSRSYHSPASENRWKYASEPEDKPASVMVIGSD